MLLIVVPFLGNQLLIAVVVDYCLEQEVYNFYTHLLYLQSLPPSELFQFFVCVQLWYYSGDFGFVSNVNSMSRFATCVRKAWNFSNAFRDMKRLSFNSYRTAGAKQCKLHLLVFFFFSWYLWHGHKDLCGNLLLSFLF